VHFVDITLMNPDASKQSPWLLAGLRPNPNESFLQRQARGAPLPVPLGGVFRMEGMEARRNDLPSSLDPYPPGSDRHALWLAGWHSLPGGDAGDSGGSLHRAVSVAQQQASSARAEQFPGRSRMPN
jgi:hypothetical protein